MPAVINSGSGGDLNPGFGGSGGPVATAIAVVRKPLINFSGGSNVLSAQTTYSFDQVSGEARIICATPTGSVGEGVTLQMGADTFVQRFGGTLVSIDTTLAPHSASLLGKGPLYAIEEYENGVQTIWPGEALGRPGLAFEDLIGGTSATLRQIVAAVLNIAGAPALHSSSDDPSHVYGLIAPEEFTWGTYETAASFLHKVLEASAGYRLFDSSDGNVYLKQISTLAGIGPEFTFTLGVDIFGDAQTTTSSIGQRTAALVEGYDDGSGAGVFTSNPGGVPIGTSVFHLSSTLIESDAFAGELAAFWLTQINRRQETMHLTTPRDDLFGPGQLHFIAGLGADTMWLKSVTTEITSNGEFSQKLTYIPAGG
jgi:hypothetical protein